MERVFYRRRSISGGVRRLFFSCLLKDSSSSTINTNSTTTRFIIDVHGKLEGDEEGEGNSKGVGELDCSRIRCIRVPKRTKSSMKIYQIKLTSEFFMEYSDVCQYHIHEVIGQGSYGIVVSATDTRNGERVAIKKIQDVFKSVSDATRILREIKFLRMLGHPNIVQIKNIILPHSRKKFNDIYVVFELMESDLYEVLRTNDDLTPEHHRVFMYQLLRALKYIHSGNLFHRDLKPKNIIVNADCKVKICDFGLARVAFNDESSPIFWTDYIATRWYRAPELCGCFFSKYTPAIDIWSIGCIFAEILTRKPIFPGKNEIHQLDIITDLLGTPSTNCISRARQYLSNMHIKITVPFSKKFRGIDPLALHLLERLLAFDPKDRPSAEEALMDPYFFGLANVEHEPSILPISRMDFEFESRELTNDDVRDLIYREILEYHPQKIEEYLEG
ncbi:Mitogen-activated protein kinase 17 [Zostera marina]|uniref:Mitogen-activated protein kinase n=1 Tax=Zostera marina TaxID=29655 RepID=A0A0K9NRX6_ZOSMR|nr:Mitogen-activated protein kinase 17 [Zostera marina]